ncbi:MAG TPA: ABC transporter substrate-binding protein [Ilumatobacter sp.]|nr:ABC transporter substrate-binding protein [Ilumatobacter sp.]
MRSFKQWVAALTAAGLVLAACGGGDDDAGGSTAAPPAGTTAPTASTSPPTDAASPGTTDAGTEAPAGDVCTEERKGGELTLTARGSSRGLDPAISTLASEYTSQEGIPFYSMLAYYDVETSETVPVLAESIEPNADDTVWTVTLREGIEFGNGDPLDAAALVAHLDRHLGPDSTSRVRSAVIYVVESWAAVDDLSVDFTLNFPYPAFPTVLAGEIGLVQNTALVEARGESFGSNPEGAGAGPYEIVEYSPPERVVFEAKDDWWGGPVCIQKLTYTFIPEMRANYEAFLQGEVDSVQLSRDPALRAEAVAAGYEGAAMMYNSAFTLMPNAGSGHTADLRVRQAMAYAIDPEVINQRAWGGDGWAGSGLIHEDSVSLEPTTGLSYDPERARELLDEYKAETGWDGSIEGLAAAQPASNVEAALAVAAMLNAVGFNVQANVDTPPADLFYRVGVEKNFELVLSWGVYTGEAVLWNSLRQWQSDNPANPNGFASEAYDAGLDALRSAPDQAAYQAALGQIQVAIDTDIPFVIYGSDLGLSLLNPAVHGVKRHQAGAFIFDQAYIEQ